MTGLKLFIGTRKGNGQYGPASREVDALKYLDILHDNGERRVLIDYAPLIEALHESHRLSNEQEIRDEYNSLFNYWQESKSYDDKSFKMHCASNLTVQANRLINKLQQRLQKFKSDGLLTYRLDPYRLDGVSGPVSIFKADVEMYIDALLVYIHSKASVDISSFKKDVVLTQYGKFLEDLVLEMYQSIISIGRHGRSDSFFKFLYLERQEDMARHLELGGKGELPDAFMLRMIKQEDPWESNDHDLGYPKQILIRYDNFWPRILYLIEMLWEMHKKINSVNSLLIKLKGGGVEWADDENSVDELRSSLQLSR